MTLYKKTLSISKQDQVSFRLAVLSTVSIGSGETELQHFRIKGEPDERAQDDFPFCVSWT
jgi:hypothetical protein